MNQETKKSEDGRAAFDLDLDAVAEERPKPRVSKEELAEAGVRARVYEAKRAGGRDGKAETETWCGGGRGGTVLAAYNGIEHEDQGEASRAARGAGRRAERQGGAAYQQSGGTGAESGVIVWA